MSKVKTVLFAALAVIAVSAVGASAASAARVWFVKGSQLAAGVTRTITAKTVAGTSWTLKAGTITITCTTMTLTGGTIENATSGGLDKGTVEFTGCSSNCGTKKVTEPIKTLGNTTELSEDPATKTKIYDLFEPEKFEAAKAEAVHAFATVKAEGCLPETTTVEGDGVAAEITEQGTEKLVHKMKFCPTITEAENASWTPAKIKLELKAFGFAKAEFCGEAEAKVLNAGIEENWSVK